jgi:hypothetical protein
MTLTRKQKQAKWMPVANERREKNDRQVVVVFKSGNLGFDVVTEIRPVDQ